MKREINFKIYFLLLLLFFPEITSAQNNKNNNVFKNLFNGFSESLSYVDIPVYATFLLRNDLEKSKLANSIYFPPFNFDHELAENSTLDKTSSIGSINKDIIPAVILGGGFLTTLSLDIFTGTNISSRDYKRLFVFYKNLIYTYTATEVVKIIVDRERPNKSDHRSFFSGHSSTTFAAVHFLNKEIQNFIDNADIKNKSTKTFLKISSHLITYGWASVVAYSRMNDNQHYLTDVLVGAGAGILIAELLHSTFMDNDSEKLQIYHSANGVGFRLTF